MSFVCVAIDENLFSLKTECFQKHFLMSSKRRPKKGEKYYVLLEECFKFNSITESHDSKELKRACDRSLH